MQSTDIRRSFLEFFAARGHKIVPSAALLPSEHCKNLLFVNAGMNAFIPCFLSPGSSPHPRMADTQRCLRAGGKHNDLEDVGFDGYHHTFFEMLGNWSFGDYFKEEAIRWAWELLVQYWHFPTERLYATVYRPGKDEPASFDQEAHTIWGSLFKAEGLDADEHVLCFGEKENFWTMGETGPCGPCSEIHIDLTPEGNTRGELVNKGDPRCIEIWNLVFMQFNRGRDGRLTALPQKCVDTGMGLERVAGILASTENFSRWDRIPSNYDSDLFKNIFQKISEMSGHHYGGTFATNRREQLGEDHMRDFAFRVIADHLRALCFAIGDGIYPRNEGRGYVLRRILRREVFFGRKLRLPEEFLAKLIPTVVDKMEGAFPQLREHQGLMEKIISSEESQFEAILDRGMALFEDVCRRVKDGVFPGDQAFRLHDTYGFPFDLTCLLAESKGFAVDRARFEAEMQKQQSRARQNQKKDEICDASYKSHEVSGASSESRPSFFDQTIFCGYEELSAMATVKKCSWSGDSPENGGQFRDLRIVVNQTPFYAEGGGQIGDTGTLTFIEGNENIKGKKSKVIETTRSLSSQIEHHIDCSDLFITHNDVKYFGKVELEVDEPRRRAIEWHHTATHLLQAALREILGKHVQQAGSWVTDQKLRFDFTHFESIPGEKLRKIEEKIQSWVLSNLKVECSEKNFDKVPEGCIALFNERYGDKVRVVEVPGISMELCGGCHVRALGEIGLFKILGESAISSGVRRIEAIAGEVAYKWFQEQVKVLQCLSQKFSVKNEDLPEKIDQLCGQLSRLETELRSHRQDKEKQIMESLCGQAETYGQDSQLLCVHVDGREPRELRALATSLLRRLKNGVVFLLATAHDDQTYHTALALAPVWIERGFQAQQCLGKIIEKWNGKCGGKHDLAMGGGISVLSASPQKILDSCRSDMKSLFFSSEA